MVYRQFRSEFLLVPVIGKGARRTLCALRCSTHCRIRRKTIAWNREKPYFLGNPSLLFVFERSAIKRKQHPIG
jgi:hypothetical protein